MVLGSVSINILILVLTTFSVIGFTRAWTRNRLSPAVQQGVAAGTERLSDRKSPRSAPSRAAGDLARGFFAAAGIVTALIIIRRAFPGITRTSDARLAWIVSVVLIEEIAKLGLTHRLRPLRAPRSNGAMRTAHTTAAASATRAAPMQHALVRGWGFAVAENILYLFLLPSRFIFRMLLAGAVHLATVVLYASPQKPHRPPAAVNITRLALATAAHTAFNLLIVSLDAIPSF